VLAAFSEGNHTFMLGRSEKKLDKETPRGMFSLIFPGSQGSHAGNTGILKPRGQGEPGQGITDPQRFETFFPDNGADTISLKDIAHVIARDVSEDKDALVFDRRTGEALASDIVALAGKTSSVLLKKIFKKDTPEDSREFFQLLTLTAGRNNLVGSSGEFGLLAAFLANSPRTKDRSGKNPLFSRQEVRKMFIQKEFPEDWKTWPKYAGDWVRYSLLLTTEAAREYIRIKRQSSEIGRVPG